MPVEPAHCFVCGKGIEPSAPVKSLATAEGKYAVHPACKHAIPQHFLNGLLTETQMVAWREDVGETGTTGQSVQGRQQPPSWAKVLLRRFCVWGLSRC